MVRRRNFDSLGLKYSPQNVQHLLGVFLGFASLVLIGGISRAQGRQLGASRDPRVRVKHIVLASHLLRLVDIPKDIVSIVRVPKRVLKEHDDLIQVAKPESLDGLLLPTGQRGFELNFFPFQHPQWDRDDDRIGRVHSVGRHQLHPVLEALDLLDDTVVEDRHVPRQFAYPLPIQTCCKTMRAGEVVRIVLVPVHEGDVLEQRGVGKLQVGQMPVEQPPGQLPVLRLRQAQRLLVRLPQGF
mmetsp:Transcript_10562/g.29070  ORF Transcript_10562/g.29070 Transcript_10562/m.29070 type:complete len:241 (+) Transcript_10562:2602-3324(+)